MVSMLVKVWWVWVWCMLYQLCNPSIVITGGTVDCGQFRYDIIN